ncbi:MAG: CYTH domain-containing protein [Patescibacteria group bacterium]
METAQQYEIEIKSLLGNRENADRLRNKLLNEERATFQGNNHQLNHYFINGSFSRLGDILSSHVKKERVPLFLKIANEGKNISLRSRKINDKIILVLKASIDNDSSANGIMRIEFEEELPHLDLSALDELILSTGFDYQAKWSRKREEYALPEITISIDENAGYGFLSEFEKVITDENEAKKTKEELLNYMAKLGIEELKQDRLERMFAFYNQNWIDYYGTDNIFTIE